MSDYLTELFKLEGKSAVVIGGGGYLCGEMSRALARAGVSVAVLDLRDQNAEAVSDEINNFGGKAFSIAIDVTRKGDFVVIDVQANAFLHHMVRNIAGALMSVGTGKQRPEWIREILEARDRTVAGVTAPPHGLYLVDVGYPEGFSIPAAQCGPAFVAPWFEADENRPRSPTHIHRKQR